MLKLCQNGQKFWLGIPAPPILTPLCQKGELPKNCQLVELRGRKREISFLLFFGGGGGGVGVFVKNKFQELTFSNIPSNSEEMYEKPLKKVLRILQKVVPLLL